ncbi:MAG: SIR2 family NAD-dependent protein deacylase [Mycobacteriales bacterium]
MRVRASDAGRVASWIAEARVIAVLTGAGISTDSGIPDYRGPQGLWTRDPGAQRLVSIDAYLADPEVRRRAWASRRAHPAWTAAPNAGHRALVDLERSGRLVALITQNIDELHQRAGSSPELTLELHGTIWQVACLDCGRRTPMIEELDRVSDSSPDPPCRSCGGILKSATISFGQPLEPGLLQRATLAAASCDLFLAVGSSLTVQPAAALCGVALAAGARLVIVNAQPTPYDQLAGAGGGAVLREPIGEVLPALVAGLADLSAGAGAAG